MQKIFAICWLTWKAALRFKLFLVIAALLILAVVGLPLVIKDDGTAEGFTQIILTYTLSVTTGLLGLSTLWLACGTLARDIEECQIQVVATKPIARWQIWLGKWFGIVTLNAVLLAIAGGCIYGLLQWRANQLPADERARLRSDILVSRGSAKEKNFDADIDSQTAQIFADRLKQNPQLANLSPPEKNEVIQQIHERVKANWQQVPPGYTRDWKIDLSAAKDSLHGKPLQVRFKFNTANPYAPTTYAGMWQIGDPNGNYWRTNFESLPQDTFHEFQIPANLFDKNGVLTVSFLNANGAALLFPLDDGMEVLYPQGNFEMNFIRGLAVLFCWMALLTALGLAAASFLSFPVASFFSLAMLTVVLSSGTMTEAIENGSAGVGTEDANGRGHSMLDPILIPAFKAVLTITSLTQTVSPIDALSGGRAISWAQLGVTFAQVVLLFGGIFAVAGMILLNRRELAAAQGT